MAKTPSVTKLFCLLKGHKCATYQDFVFALHSRQKSTRKSLSTLIGKLNRCLLREIGILKQLVLEKSAKIVIIGKSGSKHHLTKKSGITILRCQFEYFLQSKFFGKRKKTSLIFEGFFTHCVTIADVLKSKATRQRNLGRSRQMCAELSQGKMAIVVFWV